MSRTLVVGYESRNYGGERNSYAPLPDVRHVKLRRAPFELVPGPGHFGVDRIFLPLGRNPEVDLVHLWNRVSLGRTPWGVSFEDTLPWLNPQLHAKVLPFHRRRLLGQRCRFLVGMSDFAVKHFRSTLSDREWAVVEERVHQIYPHLPTTARGHPYRPPAASEPLSAIFVGVDFFRKGGESALRAVERAGDELDLRLTVISEVGGNDYSGTPPADVDVEAIRRRLADHPRITWHRRLPHNQVLEEVESHHIGLLPTYSDTFGYAVAEYMSLGVPSIVSDVQALPEFTGPDTGWQIDLPKDELGIWLGRLPGTESRRRYYLEATEHVASRIVELLMNVRERPECLRSLSASSEQRFRTQFDPQKRADAMRAVYQQAMGRA